APCSGASSHSILATRWHRRSRVAAPTGPVVPERSAVSGVISAPWARYVALLRRQGPLDERPWDLGPTRLIASPSITAEVASTGGRQKPVSVFSRQRRRRFAHILRDVVMRGVHPPPRWRTRA